MTKNMGAFTLFATIVVAAAFSGNAGAECSLENVASSQEIA